ncbi:MAG: hypothetical protein ABI051_15230 [Vicinamibacterales bacterium]
MQMPRSWLAAMIAGAVALCPAVVSAQTSLQVPLQFDFLNPGAKSLALGGAFAGVADDATASFANPAGLTLLGTPELSAELRSSRTTSLFLQRGRLSGPVINQGTDTIQGPVFGESTGVHTGLGYFSLVYPHASHRWVIAGYRHELAHIDQQFFSDGVFQKDPTEFTSRRDAPQEGIRSLSISGYGVSGAYQVRRHVAVGGGLAVYTFALDSLFRRFDVDGFLGAPKRDVEFGRSTQRGRRAGLAPTIGVLLDRGAARLGIVYRRGASFDYTTVDGSDPARTAVFRVPHTLAIGASVRVRPSLLIAGEMTRINYSRLVQDFVTDQARATGRQASFSVDDGTEWHVSAQYALRWRQHPPIRLRAGVWYDPDHSVHFAPAVQPVTATDKLFDERLSTALSTGRSQAHVAGGVGFTVSRQLELNAAVDVAPRNHVFSTSLIVHLGQGGLP